MIGPRDQDEELTEQRQRGKYTVDDVIAAEILLLGERRQWAERSAGISVEREARRARGRSIRS